MPVIQYTFDIVLEDDAVWPISNVRILGLDE